MAAIAEIPSWYPGDETKPAPMPLLLVQAFVNTLDVEEGSDLLDDTAAASAWFTATGLLAAHASVAPAEVELARTTRESIRALLHARHGDAGSERPRDGGRDGHSLTPRDLDPLRRLADAHRPRLTVQDDGRLELENPRREDLADGLFELVLIIRSAQEDGSWSRLRLCANADCRWAFYDRSRNQQGNWCNMAVCGNRLKNRHLRARRR